MHRLIISLILVVLTAIVGFGWGLDQLFDKYSNDDADNDALSAYQVLGRHIADTMDVMDAPDTLLQAWHDNGVTLALSSADTFPLPGELEPEFLSGKPLVLATEKDISIYYYLPIKKQVLSLTPPNVDIRQTESNLRLGFTLFFYGGIVVLVLLWLYPLIQRLLILRETAKAFGEGDLDRRVMSGSVSYISDIEQEFNYMANRIQTLIADNKLLTSAVSHDLRTPLARLRFGIDALSETVDPQTQKKYQRHMSDDIAEMESLVEMLLSYARLEQSMITVEKQAVDLSSLVLECAQSAQDRERNIDFDEVDQACLVPGDHRYLGILINNLLRNATQYSAYKIKMSLFERSNRYCLVIEDDGPGVPLEFREQVFKPFVRGQDDAKHKGFGMGLAIVERVAQWHDAVINISKSEQLKGARVEVEFPKYTETDLSSVR